MKQINGPSVTYNYVWNWSLVLIGGYENHLSCFKSYQQGFWCVKGYETFVKYLNHKFLKDTLIVNKAINVQDLEDHYCQYLQELA